MKKCLNPKCQNQTQNDAVYCSDVCSMINELNSTMVNLNPCVTEIQTQKIDLKPGEILTITIKHDELVREDIQLFCTKLKKIFPNNQILVMAVSTEGDIRFGIVTSQQNSYSNYCNNCSCDKKEAFESKKD